MRNRDRLRCLRRCGVSVSADGGGGGWGAFGEQAEGLARFILEQGWATVLASDAYNLQARPPELVAGRNAAAAIIGEHEASRLVTYRPWAIVSGQFAGAA